MLQKSRVEQNFSTKFAKRATLMFIAILCLNGIEQPFKRHHCPFFLPLRRGNPRLRRGSFRLRGGRPPQRPLDPRLLSFTQSHIHPITHSSNYSFIQLLIHSLSPSALRSICSHSVPGWTVLVWAHVRAPPSADFCPVLARPVPPPSSIRPLVNVLLADIYSRWEPLVPAPRLWTASGPDAGEIRAEASGGD